MSDKPVFSQWMHDVLGIRDAVLSSRLSGGNSNVTQLVDSADGQLIIRRPPDNAISPKAANGVRREHTVLSALSGRAAVPEVLGFCDDATILGNPFVVMRFVDGVSITDTLPTTYDGEAAISSVGESLIDALADVHCVDWRTVGLQEFGNPDGFLSRQIERWLRIRANDSVRELPLIDELGRWLQANQPATGAQTIIHGDYHLDNTLFDRNEPRLRAIIDWELSSIGDPLTDLGLVLAFWGERTAEPPGFARIQGVSRVATAPGRQQLAERWSRRTGIGIGQLPYYLCFAFWRLAAIVEGAYILYRRGKVDSDYARGLEYDVPALLAEASRFIE